MVIIYSQNYYHIVVSGAWSEFSDRLLSSWLNDEIQSKATVAEAITPKRT